MATAGDDARTIHTVNLIAQQNTKAIAEFVKGSKELCLSFTCPDRAQGGEHNLPHCSQSSDLVPEPYTRCIIHIPTSTFADSLI